MIIRIVKMTFVSEKVETFLEVFHASKQFIRSMPGCNHLELLNDIHSPNIFFTAGGYSRWDCSCCHTSELSPNSPRTSEFSNMNFCRISAINLFSLTVFYNLAHFEHSVQHLLSVLRLVQS